MIERGLGGGREVPAGTARPNSELQEGVSHTGEERPWASMVPGPGPVPSPPRGADITPRAVGGPALSPSGLYPRARKSAYLFGRKHTQRAAVLPHGHAHLGQQRFPGGTASGSARASSRRSCLVPNRPTGQPGAGGALATPPRTAPGGHPIRSETRRVQSEGLVT